MQRGNSAPTRARTAPPRRKACEDCSKSKRRCDLDLPACSRCSKLGLNCHYHVPPRKAIGSTKIAAVDDLDTANSCLPQLDVDVLDGCLHYDESLDLSFMDEPPKSGPMTYSMDHLLNSEVMSIADPVSIDLFNPNGSRLHYTIEIFKSSPARMVHENSTPWCHLLLYKDQMPKSMHDAYSACAMYLAKNDVNKMMTFRAIERNAAELKRSPQSTLPIEILARTQSLLMYQIIRLFDGDIRLRALGEAGMSDLEASSYQLLGLLDSHGMWIDVTESHTAPDPSADPPSHATWIFQESCRRTVLISLFFVSFYAMVREGSCIHGMIAAARSWTFGVHLWNARSEFDFKVAWREKRHFIIQNLDFEEVLSNASPGDVDDFGKSFLVMSQGLDEVKEWYYNQGFKFDE